VEPKQLLEKVEPKQPFKKVVQKFGSTFPKGGFLKVDF
jgi:hypothetical protein